MRRYPPEMRLPPSRVDQVVTLLGILFVLFVLAAPVVVGIGVLLWAL